jgi:hypothetical protein
MPCWLPSSWNPLFPSPQVKTGHFNYQDDHLMTLKLNGETLVFRASNPDYLGIDYVV